MKIADLDDTRNNLQTYSDSELNILDDHVSTMLFKVQSTGPDEAVKYWNDLSAMVKATVKGRSVANA